MRQEVALLLALGCTVLHGCNGSSNPSPTTTTTAPRIVTTEFTLSRPDCFFGWSRPLEPVAVGETFTIRFKPLSIDDVEDSEWLNTVEFWLDRLEEGNRDAIALVIAWAPNSEWFIDVYTPEGGFQRTFRRELINVNGEFREITYVRANGVSEWLLDGVVVLQIPDTMSERTVYTRVVGTDTLFQFEEVVGGSTLRTTSSSTGVGACIVPGPAMCAQTAR